MLTSFFRTVILLFFVILSLRLMGKRQIGELQPGELVVTILLSQIAATPMQDNDIPLLHTLVCIFTLAGVELLLSALSMKSETVRTLIDGGSVTVMRGGALDQKALRRLRFTIDDLLEGLRQKDVFDLSSVDSVIAETNGALSVLLKKSELPVTAKIMQKDVSEGGMPQVLVADGKIRREGLSAAGLTEAQLARLLEKEQTTLENTFLLTLDAAGKTFLVRKEAAV